MNIKHRNQVADLILKDEKGNDLVILSTLTKKNGSMSFVVGKNEIDGARYRVKISIKER